MQSNGHFCQASATRCRFQSRGHITGGLWYSSLQTVDHVSHDRIRQPFSSQQAFEIGQDNWRFAFGKYLLDTVIHNLPMALAV
jgi:hypothetical protein